MKSVLPAAIAAVLASVAAPGYAASDADEIAQIREQLQTLMQRVDKLEGENTALKAENENLKAQDEYLKAEAKGLRKDSAIHGAEVAKVKGADWAGKVAIKGDMRYRYEMISDETVNALGVQTTADRYRDRIRARVNVEGKATDNILVGIGFATTEGGDPRSSNQSLDNVFSRKSLDLDLAYFDWKVASWGNLVGGKMKQPFVKPGQSTYFWDNDINPEGLAFNFSRGIWFATAYNFWVDEVSNPETSLTADAHLSGAQIGARLPIGASSLILGAHYYDLGAGQGRRGVLFNCSNPAPAVSTTTPATVVVSSGNYNCANGNSVTGGNGVGVLTYDYQVAEIFAEFNTTLGALPLQVWADVAENQDPEDLNTAWAAGFRLGLASNSRTWEFGAAYVSLEKDALFAQLIDSDFGGGLTDTQGFVVRAGYAPVKNWVVNASYFLNDLNVDRANSVGDTEVGYDRLQVDFNLKF